VKYEISSQAQSIHSFVATGMITCALINKVADGAKSKLFLLETQHISILESSSSFGNFLWCSTTFYLLAGRCR
jgi:hypothetical protein